jgi:hypothetical protein
MTAYTNPTLVPGNSELLSRAKSLLEKQKTTQFQVPFLDKENDLTFAIDQMHFNDGIPKDQIGVSQQK